MSICKLISEEIVAIQKDQLDISDLSPENYEIYLDKLSDRVKHLEKIKNLLELDSITLENFDDLSKNGIINMENLNLENFASTVEEITEDTVVFVGTLEYKTYEKLNTHSLPNNLRFITESLYVNYTNISSIILDYVKELKAQECNALESISIRNVGSLDISHCPEISSLKLAYVKDKLILLFCPKLKIDGVESFHPNQKIVLGTSTVGTKFSFHELTTKFSFATVNFLSFQSNSNLT